MKKTNSINPPIKLFKYGFVLDANMKEKMADKASAFSL